MLHIKGKEPGKSSYIGDDAGLKGLADYRLQEFDEPVSRINIYSRLSVVAFSQAPFFFAIFLDPAYLLIIGISLGR